MVAELLASAIQANYKDYRTTLGALVVLGSVDGGWKPDGELSSEFERLESSPNMDDADFKKWYTKAENNK